MEGLHLTADCFNCLCDSTLLFEEKRLSELVRHHTKQTGLTIVGEKFHAFTYADGSAAGVTGTLLLAESHVAIHTWPERQAVTLDVYVCNFENDNSQRAREIVDQMIAIFQPQEVSRQSLQRGLPAATKPAQAIEQLSPYTAMQTKIDRVLAEVQSPYQLIQVADTPEFGKTMRIDGAMMTSEKDEFYYHESLIHPATITHSNPQTALIIGGGDGGSTEELLKHPSIQKITLCEIDPIVIKLARDHLASIHKNVFDSPKVQIIHADGFAFIQNNDEKNREQYDLIFLDLTDPIAPNGSNLAESCMSEAFFQACTTRLNHGGILVLHLGSQFYHEERYQSTLHRLKNTFEVVHPYAVFIPLYGALWGMAMAKQSDVSHKTATMAATETTTTNLTPQIIAERLQARQIKDLRYYSAQRHAQMFVP